MADTPIQQALGDAAARQLANATKTAPQLSTISPRWLTHFLQWIPVEAGIYRLNKVRDPEAVKVLCAQRDESELPVTYVDYQDQPREYFLNSVATVLDVHTRVSDLYSSPHDQKASSSTTPTTGCSPTWPTSSASARSLAHPRPTTWTTCSPRSGRSRRSFSRTRWALPRSAVSARGAACRRRR
jgi:hypothetical protein